MSPADSPLLAFMRYGREARNLEYKGAAGREPFDWAAAHTRARITRTAMAMANIGGGTIVIGVDEVGVDR